MLYVIRSNINNKIGAGHIYRLLRLSDYLLSQNNKIIFVLDNPLKNINKLIKYNIHYLYNSKNLYENSFIDSMYFIRLIKNYKKLKLNIILDDYRLGFSWGKKVKPFCNKLIVFDDFKIKKHFADYYINYKNDLSFKKNSTLNNIIPKKCVPILGPQYSIINKSLKRSYIKKSKYNILFYNGSSGSLKIFLKIIINLLNNNSSKINIFVLVGITNQENNTELILLSRVHKNLILIRNQNDTSSILSKTDLFIGSSGNLIYELSYLKIPSIFFPTARNQNNYYKDLEDLGHFFSISQKDLKYTLKITSLIRIIIINYERIRKLNINSLIKIDKLGPKRIYNIINFGEIKNESENYNHQIKINKTSKISKLSDNIINDLLLTRNKLSTRKLMINKNKISKIDHYIWWFSNDRKNFLYNKDNTPSIYFWHKKILINNQFFFIGGWSLNSNNVSAWDIYKMLCWQLNKTKIYKKSKWIAVINKKNKFVLKLNLYLGFKIAKKNSYLYTIIKNYFKVSKSDFYFLHR
jgi:spore coat polysaccharide biosynthesis predicted glycosyltransferase SpsG